MSGFPDGLQPIETRYKGYRFRSRLEARWAVFLDAIGAEWEYEKQGYSLNGVGRGRPYPELSIEDNYRRLQADAETDNREYLSYRFMHWGPTADNVRVLLFREAGIAYLPFSFCWPDGQVPSELGKVFVAELSEWELAGVMHDAAWALMWDWADRSKWPK
jgi:hypothetical protein